MNDIKVIAFDADDTLWVNETFFRDVESQFYTLLEEYCSAEILEKELYQMELKNLSIYGYGIKGFMLSMIETALKVSHHQVSAAVIQQIIVLGQTQLNEPVELLPGVEHVLSTLQPTYELVLATKGDLTDQRRKLELSGLKDYFSHVEVMTDKTILDYQLLFDNLNCSPQHLLMVGNSLKSDVQPVLELGGYAAHIPFHTTWSHEVVTESISHSHLLELAKIEDLLAHVGC